MTISSAVRLVFGIEAIVYMAIKSTMLQHVNSLQDRRNDYWLVMKYKIANENVVITKQDLR